jgi:hypothetical protein
MKTLRALALLLSISAAAVAGDGITSVEGVPVPKLEDALKFKTGRALVFQPVTLGRGHSLDVRHIRIGDGSVRPGEERQAMLVIYNATPDIAGQHTVLSAQLKSLAPGASPVNVFEPYQPSGEAEGIIAILIGLVKPANGTARPSALPSADVVTAEITDGTSTVLLLPAVQKVRGAAAR